MTPTLVRPQWTQVDKEPELMTKTHSRILIDGVTVALLGLAVSVGAVAQQRIELMPDEYSLWEAIWYVDEVDELWISDVDSAGFRYSLVERVRPNSPDMMTREEGRAFFVGTHTARSEERGGEFLLRIAVGDSHDRDITYRDVVYKWPRTTFRAGFDCGKATTLVELAICGNRQIAAGDYELNRFFGALLDGSPTEHKRTLRSDQRAWLARRNRDCLDGSEVDLACLARHYSNRLVGLARLTDPALGAGSVFDAAYLRALSERGVALHKDPATRLAMFPDETDCPTSSVSVGANGGVLVEQSCYGDGHDLWPPISLDFPITGYIYSAVLFVDSAGGAWAATHTDIIMSVDYDELVQLGGTRREERIWMDAGSSHFSIRSDAGFTYELKPQCLDNFTERDHPLATVVDPPPMPDPRECLAASTPRIHGPSLLLWLAVVVKRRRWLPRSSGRSARCRLSNTTGTTRPAARYGVAPGTCSQRAWNRGNSHPAAYAAVARSSFLRCGVLAAAPHPTASGLGEGVEGVVRGAERLSGQPLIDVDVT